MENQENRIVGVHWLGDAVDRLLIFFLKGSKHAIPENKGGTVVFVDVALVDSVVYPMMGWGGKEVLDGLRQFLDEFGVNPELIKRFDL